MPHSGIECIESLTPKILQPAAGVGVCRESFYPYSDSSLGIIWGSFAASSSIGLCKRKSATWTPRVLSLALGIAKKHLQFCARRSWGLSYFIHICMGYKPTGPYFTERIEKNSKFFIMCIDSYLVYCVATWSHCRGIITSC